VPNPGIEAAACSFEKGANQFRIAPVDDETIVSVTRHQSPFVDIAGLGSGEFATDLRFT
jgi:hypothetical protein